MTGDVSTFVEEAKPIVASIVQVMGNGPFLAGQEVTYLDFVFFEQLEAINTISEKVFYLEFESLWEYSNNVTSLAGFKDFWQDDEKSMKRPLNNNIAKLNN